MRGTNGSRYAIAKSLGMPSSTLYYQKKLPEKDRALKIRIEEALRYYPSYGHRRLAPHLQVNKKRILSLSDGFLRHFSSPCISRHRNLLRSAARLSRWRQ